MKKKAAEEAAKELTKTNVDQFLKDREKPGPHIPLDEVVEQSNSAEPDYILRQLLQGDESAVPVDSRGNPESIDFDDNQNPKNKRNER